MPPKREYNYADNFPASVGNITAAHMAGSSTRYIRGSTTFAARDLGETTLVHAIVNPDYSAANAGDEAQILARYIGSGLQRQGFTVLQGPPPGYSNSRSLMRNQAEVWATRPTAPDLDNALIEAARLVNFKANAAGAGSPDVRVTPYSARYNQYLPADVLALLGKKDVSILYTDHGNGGGKFEIKGLSPTEAAQVKAAFAKRSGMFEPTDAVVDAAGKMTVTGMSGRVAAMGVANTPDAPDFRGSDHVILDDGIKKG